jgi:acyl-CoA reductase-like NAD-dependent aldehyde dehydrogenase
MLLYLRGGSRARLNVSRAILASLPQVIEECSPSNSPLALLLFLHRGTSRLRKAGAALAAGCTMIVKPSPETPLTCLALTNLATQAGFTPGVLNIPTTKNDETRSLSEALYKHPSVSKVSFTGSARGKQTSHQCSGGLKKVTLELGGNFPLTTLIMQT